MKITIEIDFEVDGEITIERAGEVFISSIPVFIDSESHDDGDRYALIVNSMEARCQ